MKKTAITLLMATAMISAKAQNFQFGIKAGVNFSKESKTEVEREVKDQEHKGSSPNCVGVIFFL
ncbi:hypothetical protein [Alloprevotella rava]|uniref:PorT family protein n=1 Tax=Alloprevotella rava TaxID=671218 RepID=A0A7W5XY32_9BACT|nr:hypothetical protein [Alloprevotella rava]MBB3703103.1 hypothetical protein [Alloprevotella rava]